MSLAETLRKRLGPVVHGLRRFRGNLDGYIGGALVGWVVPRDAQQGPVKVGLYAAQGLITQTTANVFRGDLLQSGISKGYNGFSIGLDPIMLRSIRAGGGRVQVKTLGPHSQSLGRYDFGKVDAGSKSGAKPSNGADNAGNSLSQQLFGDLQQFQGLLEAASNAPAMTPPALSAHAALFDRADYINGGDLPALMTGYSEYVRYRYKLDQTFDPQGNPVDAEHFLHWYIAGYSTLRSGLRVPIAKPVLDYLNAPVTIPGQRASLSRAAWAFLMNVPPILQSIDFKNPEWVAWATYWWAIDQAKAMHVEDCLVPQSCIDLLSAIPDVWADRAFAPNQFLQRLHTQTPALSVLDLEREDDRRQLILAVMVMAVQRPDYLRYVPVASIDALLGPDPSGASAFSAFCHKLMPDLPPIITGADYAAVLRLKSYDLNSRQFLTFTPEGHRVEVACLPAVTSDESVDLQLIGPFEKASGLGQATRLSAAVIAQIGADPAPITVNSVNFGLDNPAPEGFSRVGELSGYKRAKINLIHLNAESIPLAYAYQPDVFSGAYNIGYFFWELDTPAACHYLGMNLLDEIWVSTDYGVQIYQPESKGPVSNVGMCFEDLPEIDRGTARQFVQDRFGFDDQKFVFLVAFDSFSFVQRKNPVGTLQAFKSAFDGVEDVRLVIKTQNRRKVTDPVQEKIWRQVDALIKGDARIVVLDETLSYDDLLKLKKGCDAYVSLHKSEGWGFGMIEAMNLGVPVVCTGYSGNMDFCSPETAWLVGYSEIALEQDDYIFVRPGQKWAEPDLTEAAQQMRAVYSDPKDRAARVAAALHNVRQNFSAQAISKRYETRLRDILKSI